MKNKQNSMYKQETWQETAGVEVQNLEINSESHRNNVNLGMT